MVQVCEFVYEGGMCVGVSICGREDVGVVCVCGVIFNMSR